MDPFANYADATVWYHPLSDNIFIFHKATFFELPCLERGDGKKMIVATPHDECLRCGINALKGEVERLKASPAHTSAATIETLSRENAQLNADLSTAKDEAIFWRNSHNTLKNAANDLADTLRAKLEKARGFAEDVDEILSELDFSDKVVLLMAVDNIKVRARAALKEIGE